MSVQHVGPEDGGPNGSVHVHDDPAAGGRWQVDLTGDVDAELGGDLDDALAAYSAAKALGGAQHVVVDTRGVSFMDSTGVAFLSRLAVRARPGRVRVLHPSEPVAFLLKVTNMSAVVDVED